MENDIQGLTGCETVVGAKKMKSQRPDLLVIISFVFVIGAVATSLTANGDGKVNPKIAHNVSQHIIR